MSEPLNETTMLTAALHTLMNDLNIGELTKIQENELKAVLTGNQQAIQIPGDTLGRCAIEQHHIYTGSEQPLYQAPYRVPYQQMDALKKGIRGMEEQGVIEPSNSPCLHL